MTPEADAKLTAGGVVVLLWPVFAVVVAAVFLAGAGIIYVDRTMHNLTILGASQAGW